MNRGGFLVGDGVRLQRPMSDAESLTTGKVVGVYGHMLDVQWGSHRSIETASTVRRVSEARR